MEAMIAAVAAAGLPPAGQQAAAEKTLNAPSPVRWASVLSARVDLTEQAAGILSAHPSMRIRWNATASGPGAEGRTLDLNGMPAWKAGAYAANRRSDPEALTILAGHRNREVVLRAMCNPSTPIDVRQNVLTTAGLAEHLVARVSPLGAQVVRAGELTSNNRWMLHAGTRSGAGWGPAVLRGLTCLPECPASFIEQPGTARYVHMWVSAATHPVRHGQDVRSMTDDQLAASPSGAAHAELLSRDSCTAAHAARMLQGHQLPSGRRVDMEPHLIAAAYRRFASDIHLHGRTPSDLAGTRIDTAGWAEPLAGELLRVAEHRVDLAGGLTEAGKAFDIIGQAGGDVEIWRTFLEMADRLSTADRLTEAAELAAACR